VTGDAGEGPRLLLGAPIAAEIRASVERDVAAFRGRHGYAPALAVLIVGRDAPSAVYLNQILKRSGIPLAGRRAVVVGRSNVVGKPAALLLMREHATVTLCHSRTTNLEHYTRDAEILVVAAGRPGLITGTMLSKGVVVVDVGINVVDDRLVGDVDFESASTVASAITPVPGGVGPVTNALLLTHLVRAAQDQAQAGGSRANGVLQPAGSRP
jgi:5,10-methylene-tetrahydrofolate dehydrogenase/methenyl tetrahydrofolate cyclohydrolase